MAWLTTGYPPVSAGLHSWSRALCSCSALLSARKPAWGCLLELPLVVCKIDWCIVSIHGSQEQHSWPAASCTPSTTRCCERRWKTTPSIAVLSASWLHLLWAYSASWPLCTRSETWRWAECLNCCTRVLWNVSGTEVRKFAQVKDGLTTQDSSAYIDLGGRGKPPAEDLEVAKLCIWCAARWLFDVIREQSVDLWANTNAEQENKCIILMSRDFKEKYADDATGTLWSFWT